MSGYMGLSDTTQTLVNLIWNAIKDDKQINGVIHKETLISAASPKDAEAKSDKISIYLYNITETSGMRNQPPTQQLPEKPPTLMYLTLHYLITPTALEAGKEQMVLGKIMQLFAQNPVLRGSALQGSLAGTNTNLRVTLDSLSVDEINKLWSVFGTPHKPSLSYSVSPVTIDSVRVLDQTRVVEEKINYTQVKTLG
jgi:hypothetical protein